MSKLPPPVRRKNRVTPDREYRKYLLPEEMDLIIDAARKRELGQRDRLMLEFMYNHGLTPSQALNLKWEDIDLFHKTVAIWRDDVTPGIHYLEIEEVKELRWWKHQQKTERKYGGPSPYVFAGRGSWPMSNRMLHTILQDCATAAGIMIPVRPLMIRHSKGYELMASRVDLMQATLFLGNKRVDTTAKYAPPVTIEETRGFSSWDTSKLERARSISHKFLR